MPYDYAAEKYHTVLDILITNSGSLQERLADAVMSHLHRVEPQKDLPTELAAQHEYVMSQMTAHAGPRGSITETAKRLTDEQAKEIASIIFSNHNWLARHTDFYDDA